MGLCLLWLFGIYGWFLVRHCGSRPAGESLFSTAKKVTKKAATTAAPRKKTRGSHLASIIIMLRQNSQKALKHAGTESS